MYDVLIIGGGPAGLCAGIYAKRAGLSVALIEKLAVGGQASTTPEIENYPGVEKTDGFSLTYTMLKQCQNFGVELFVDQITKYDFINKKFTTNSNGEISARTVILATGASPKKMEIEKENELIGAGISYCATCDGAFFKNKVVAVVGGGNTAVEDALYLESFAKTVYLIHRRDSLRADKTLQGRLEKSKVKVLWNSVITKLTGLPKLTEITVKDVKTNTLTPFSVDGVFVAIGQKPQSDEFANQIEMQNGYVVTDDAMRTNIDGVFAAGDIRVKQLRQVVTAVADGAIAADSAIKYLLEKSDSK